MESLRKHWTAWLFIFLIFLTAIFATVRKIKKERKYMIEKTEAWGGVEITRHKLRNGLDIILALDKNVPVFAYHTWFNVGSRHEKKGKTGIAHFFEHLLFKETKNLKEGEFDRIMESNGAITNAATWVDWTYYHEVLPSDPEKMEIVIRLESDRMSNMILNEKQIESERGVIQNERRFRVDNDIDGVMNEKLDSMAYQMHPYGQPTIGWMEDISKLSLQDCIYFYKTYYAPNNATLIVVGNFDQEKVLGWIEEYYGSIPSSEIPERQIPKEPPQRSERRVSLERDDIDTEKAIYAYHATDYKHRDTPALELLAEILFNGEGSRLYKRMVIDEEIATQISATLPHFKDPALFQIAVSMRKGHAVKKADERIFKEIGKIQKEGINQKELDRAKNRFEMDYYRGFESVNGKARALGHYHIISGDYKTALHLLDGYQAVTAADIQAVSKNYLTASNRTVVAAAPKRGKAKEAKKRLKAKRRRK